jgi:hypothetical protein
VEPRKEEEEEEEYSVKNTGYKVHHYAIFSTFHLPPFQVQISSSTLCSKKKPSVYVPPSK